MFSPNKPDFSNNKDNINSYKYKFISEGTLKLHPNQRSDNLRVNVDNNYAFSRMIVFDSLYLANKLENQQDVLVIDYISIRLLEMNL